MTNSTASVEPLAMCEIALWVKTYGELDAIERAWMVSQMESDRPDVAVPSACAAPGTFFLGAVA